MGLGLWLLLGPAALRSTPSCCFNTNMNSLKKFEYFEYKHIVRKKNFGAFGAGQFSLETLVGG